MVYVWPVSRLLANMHRLAWMLRALPQGFPELLGVQFGRDKSNVSREAGAKDNWVVNMKVALFEHSGR